jgi:hypothetical protein
MQTTLFARPKAVAIVALLLLSLLVASQIDWVKRIQSPESQISLATNYFTDAQLKAVYGIQGSLGPVDSGDELHFLPVLLLEVLNRGAACIHNPGRRVDRFAVVDTKYSNYKVVVWVLHQDTATNRRTLKKGTWVIALMKQPEQSSVFAEQPYAEVLRWYIERVPADADDDVDLVRIISAKSGAVLQVPVRPGSLELAADVESNIITFFGLECLFHCTQGVNIEVPEVTEPRAKFVRLLHELVSARGVSTFYDRLYVQNL